ncbi:gliding motility-associated C-terminal domain-containing protein [Flavobacteriales bacterium AH-315-E23]|nr:gliding motility-associated C-terminal domain-containing protein [Flavobacteriales bacterium AH-315-E23]
MKPLLKTGLVYWVRTLCIFCIAVLMLLNPALINEARASHGVGSELTYECLGGNNYEFSLYFYRDCGGIGMGASQDITIASAFCAFTGTLTLSQVGAAEDISPLCPTALSECAGGTEPGVEKYLYQGSFVLPFACPDWIFSFEQCCRSADITNLVSPNSQYSHIMSTLDNSSGICNTSPSFTTSPVPYICDSQLVNYNMGTFDADGDSLYYTLVNALGAGGTLLSYVGGYSPTYPISTTTGSVNFDSTSGNLQITPDSIQVCIVTVLVEEYRNGVLIGSVMRDVQVRVLDCASNLIPYMSSGGIINLTGGGVLIDSNSVSVCAGTPVDFDLIASDDNSGDSLTMTTNLSLTIPTASFTSTTGVSPIQGSFSWLPLPADSGLNTFTVTIQDDACPILGIQSYDFDIEVIVSTYAGEDAIYCPGGVPVQLNASGGTAFTWSPSTGLSCTSCPDPNATPSATTDYIVTSNLGGGCQNTDTVTVFAVTLFTISVTPLIDTICLNESVQLNVITDPADGPFTYFWEDPNGDLTDPTIADPIASPAATTIYRVEVVSGNGCTLLDSLLIIVSGVGPVVTVTPVDTNICEGESVQLNATAVFLTPCEVDLSLCSVPVLSGQLGSGTLNDGEVSPFTGNVRGARNQYLYLATDLLAAGYSDGAIQVIGWNVLVKNSTVPFDLFTISLGCTSADSLDSTTWQATSTVFGPAPYSTVLGANLIPLDSSYNWDGVSNLVVEICWENSGLSDEDSVEYAMTSYFSTVNNSSTFMGTGCTLTPEFGYTKLPNLQLSICPNPPIIPVYDWSPSTGLSDTTIADPIATPVTTTSYLVTVRDSGSTCAGSAVTTINVGADYTLTTSNDTGICFGDTITISTIPNSPGVYTYLWFPPDYISDTTVGNPEVFPEDSMMYYVEVSNGSCFKTDSVLIAVSGMPMAASADPAVICSGTQTVQLNVVGPGNPGICGISTLPCYGGSSYDVGDGSISNSSTAYPAPYGHWFRNTKHQILYIASDLEAAGLTAGTINSLGFNIDVINGTSEYRNFEIKIGCTTVGDMSTWLTGLSPVFSPKTVSITPGWNMYTFDTNYDWDGISNIVVEICFDNRPDPWTLNSSTFYSVTGYTSVVYFRSDFDHACSSGTITATSSSRPNIRFNMCYSDTSLPAGYTYAWSPNIGLSDSTLQDPIATINSTTTYLVDITDLNGCVYSHDVTITQNNVSAIISDSGDVSCKGPATGYATGRLVGGTPPYTYAWDDPALQTDSTADSLTVGFYTVVISDAFGCSDTASVTIGPTPPPLDGVYTIGGVLPDYPDFTQAVKDLNIRGVSASVIFNVRSGTYNEQIEIDSICGSSATNIVIFQSEVLDSTAVTLTFAATSADNYTVRFNNADFVIFKHLTLASTDATYGRVAELINGASNIRLASNIISGLATISTLNTRALVFMATGDGNNNVFRNNIFNNGSHAVYTITTEPGMRISQNILLNQYYMGLWIQNKNAIIVVDNIIQTNSALTFFYGMYLNNCDNTINVSSNQISSATAGGYGMLLSGCDGTALLQGLISNNFIQLGTSGTAYGIFMSTSNNYINVYHNSVHITSTSTLSARPFYSTTSGSNISVLNNIFSNSGGGYSVYINTAAVISDMNYNDHYTTGPELGYNEGTTYVNLAAWQIGTGRDLNSVSVDPVFTSTSDLHLTIGSPDTLKSGTNLSFLVPQDIDNTVRDIVPWMGAHESTISPCSTLTLTTTVNDNLCESDSSGSIIVTVTGGNTPYSYQWDDPGAQTNDTASVLIAGVYQVIITDFLGCIDSISDTVFEPTALVPQITDSTGLTCFGSNDGTAIVQITGGTGPYLITWTPSGNINDTATGLSGGTETVTVIDNNGCTAVDSVTISEPVLLSAVILDSSDISCNGFNDGFAVAGATGGTSPYGFIWTPSGSTNDTASGLGAGVHQVKISDVNGCADSVTVTIDEPAILIPDAGIFSTICEGDSIQIGASPTASGGVGPYTYAWSPAASLNDSTIANPIAGPITTTAYLLTLLDNNGCISTDGVTISVNPSFSTIANAEICANDSIFLGGAYRNTAGIYVDSLLSILGCDSVVSTSLTVKDIAVMADTAAICAGDSAFLAGAFQTTAGQYMDTYTASNGCDSIVNTELQVIASITTNLQDTICDGDSIFLAGAFQYLAGTYVDSFIAGSGCDSLTSTNLIVNPVFSVLDTFFMCDNDSVFLGGAFRTTAGTYIDTLGSISGCDSVINTTLILLPTYTQSASAAICANDSIFLGGAYRNSPGNYTDTLSAINSCDSVVVTTLAVNPVFATPAAATICGGDSILLGGAFRTIAGVYTDSLSSVDGCDSIISTTLTVNPSYSINLSESICNGDSTFIAGAYRFTAGVYSDTLATVDACDSVLNTTLNVNPTYAINDTVYICDGDTAFLGGAPQTVTGTYIDSFITVANCDSVVITFLSVGAPISLVVSSFDALCDGSCDGTALATAGGGTGTYAYAWSTSPVQVDSIAVNLCVGTYTVTVTDGAGCQSIDSTAIGQPLPLIPLITSTVQPSCFGSCDGSVTASISGGSTPYVVSWDDPSNQTTLTASNLCAGTFIISVIDSNGCTASTLATLTNPNGLAVSVSGTDSICAGGCTGTATAAVTGGTSPFTFLWNNGATTSTVTSLCLNTYTVSVTDSGGCVALDSITVSNYPIENASFSYPATVFCQNAADPIPTLAGDAGGIFSGPPSLSIVAATGLIDLSASIPGTYNVVYTSGGPCPESDTVQVTIIVAPAVTIAPFPPICGLDTNVKTLSASPPGGIWSGPGIIDPANGIFSPALTGPGFHPVSYTVTNSGCSDADTMIVRVLPVPTMSLSGTQTICEGGSTSLQMNLTGIGPFVVTYEDGTDTTTIVNISSGDSLILSPTVTTTYTLVGIWDSLGCDGAYGGSLTVNVVAVPPPPIPTTPVYHCAGDPNPQLSALPQGGGTLNWYDDTLSAPLATGNTFTPLTYNIGSNYFYVSELIGGCSSSAVEVELIVFSQGSVDAGSSVTICLGNSTTLLATGGTSYAWYPSSGLSDTSIANPEARPTTTTTYYVIATVNDSCNYTDSVRIDVDNSLNCGWHIYNGFTPNGDGDNDTWIIDGIAGFPNNKVTIFNRWEDVVNDFDGYDNETIVWKGHNKGGQELPEGTYFYIINTGEEKFAGWVQLTR